MEDEKEKLWNIIMGRLSIESKDVILIMEKFMVIYVKYDNLHKLVKEIHIAHVKI